MSSAWRVNMLGRFEATRSGRAITKLQTRKITELLAYLACFRQRPLLRTELAEVIWPEVEEKVGRLRLNQALWSLRRQFEPPGTPEGSFILADRNTVQLNPAGVHTDVGEFDASIRQASKALEADKIELYEKAVAIYEGEFLPSYHEEWVLAERQRIAQLNLQAASSLVSAYRHRGDWTKAIHYAKVVTQLEPLDEEAHETLIRLCLEANLPAEALRHHQGLATILDEQLGIAPSAESQQLKLEAQRRLDLKRKVLPTVRSDTKARTSGAAPHAPNAGQLSFQETPRVAKATTVLPLQLTQFIGRTGELGELSRTFEQTDTRIVTLHGMGGCGKTRLAIEFARSAGELFRAGIWFVPLAKLQDPSLILPAIREALQLGDVPDQDAAQQVANYLQTATSSAAGLLILDNFEHLAVEGSASVTSLANQVPGLRFLITSRQLLNVEGETEYSVDPLPVVRSDTRAQLKPEELLEVPSIALFVNRAQVVKPHFQITDRTARDVARLCESLEGLPLAIELAATWIQVLTPAQMLQRLSKRFDFLSSRKKGVESRHRSLQAVLDYSFDQLTPRQKRIVSRASIFRGGWSVEAIEKVCGAEDEIEGIPVLEALLELQERSLIRSETCGDSIRFRMLETVREYMAAKLSDEERRELEMLHADCYIQVAEELEKLCFERSDSPQLIEREAEFDNIRAALTSSLGQGRFEIAASIVLALSRTWVRKGLIMEAAGYLNAIGKEPSSLAALPQLQAQVTLLQGRLAFEAGHYEQARQGFQAALAAFDTRAEESGVAHALYGLACVHFRYSEFEETTECANRCLDLGRQTHNDEAIADAHLILGNAALYQSQFDQALQHYQESLDIEHRLGRPQRLYNLQNNTALVYTRQNQPRAAKAILEQVLTKSLSRNDLLTAARARINLGNTCTKLGSYHEAVQHYIESLHFFQGAGERFGTQLCLACLARVAEHCGDPFTATMITSGVAKHFDTRLTAENSLSTLPSTLQNVDAEEMAAAAIAGQALSLQEVIEIAFGVQSLVQKKSA